MRPHLAAACCLAAALLPWTVFGQEPETAPESPAPPVAVEEPAAEEPGQPRPAENERALPPRIPEGWRLGISAALGQVYNDNLFYSSSAPQGDFITRLSPRADVTYRDGRLALFGHYGFDAEAFARAPELTEAFAAQDAEARLQWIGTALEVYSSAAYVETQNASELNLLTAIGTGRREAHRVSAHQSLTWRPVSVLAVTGRYDFSRDNLSGGLTGQTHEGALDVDRRVSERDWARLGYTARRFSFQAPLVTFDETGAETTTETALGVTSHLLRLGWTRQLTPRTRFQVEGGPRISPDGSAPELALSLRHRLATGQISLTAYQTETRVVGQAGRVSVRGVGALVARSLSRRVQLTVAPDVLSSSRDDLRAHVFRLGLDLTWRLTRWLALSGSHSYTLQKGSVDLPEVADVANNVVQLRLTALRAR